MPYPGIPRGDGLGGEQLIRENYSYVSFDKGFFTILSNKSRNYKIILNKNKESIK